jgi:hypothetical protein
VVECNPDCLMKILRELCESWFCEEIGTKISRERKDEDWGSIYTVEPV